MYSLASKCRPHSKAALFCSRRCPSIKQQGYAQQHAARVPQSVPQQSTSNPSTATRVKNQSLDGSDAKRVFRKNASQSETQGVEAFLPAMLAMKGTDLWAQKFPLLDLRIPRKYGDALKNGTSNPPIAFWRAFSDNSRNRWQNILSMFRMANEFAFPGINTKRRFSPQLFMTQSSKQNAWIAPLREEVLKIYKEMNQAIASGDEKTIKRITSYEFQTRALSLIKKKLNSKTMDRTFVWKLHEEIQPCRIVSLRAVPGHFGMNDPAIGNRLVVQLIARFETLQSLEVRNRRGQRLLANGNVASPSDPPPEPRRVLEYIIFENKMWYADGWTIRSQVYEGVEGNYREIES